LLALCESSDLFEDGSCVGAILGHYDMYSLSVIFVETIACEPNSKFAMLL
jgi:hypothetical protein